MKLRVFVYRLAAALTAFVFGVGIFNAWRYFQTPEETVVAVTALPLNKQETIFLPPPVEPFSAAVVDSTEDAKEAEEETEPEFITEGAYYIIGNQPKGFKDIDGLEIIATDYADELPPESYNGRIPPKGYISTNKEFNFTRINIGNGRIAFETETKKGVSYKFVGEFIEGEKIEYKTAEGVEYVDYAVLKGRLTKWRNGKVVAEAEVNLAAGGC